MGDQAEREPKIDRWFWDLILQTRPDEDALRAALQQMDREALEKFVVFFHLASDYVRDPWNSLVEYFCDIDFIPDGGKWETKNWPPEDSLAGATGILAIDDRRDQATLPPALADYFESVTRIDSIEVGGASGAARRIDLYECRGYRGHPRAGKTRP